MSGKSINAISYGFKATVPQRESCITLSPLIFLDGYLKTNSSKNRPISSDISFGTVRAVAGSSTWGVNIAFIGEGKPVKSRKAP